MKDINTKVQEFEQSFISVKKTLKYMMESMHETSHASKIMNLRFFKNQTCLVCDGFDLDIIAIDHDSKPSYQEFKSAIEQFTMYGTECALLDEYGFTKKRTLENLINDGVKIPQDELLSAKSFIPNDDFNETALLCLPYEYTILLKDYEKLKSDYERLKQRQEPFTPAQPKTEPIINFTLEMQATNAVYHEFWQNLAQNAIPPKKETIKAWIIQKYRLSENMASAIDSIVRPNEHRQGGMKAR